MVENQANSPLFWAINCSRQEGFSIESLLLAYTNLLYCFDQAPHVVYMPISVSEKGKSGEFHDMSDANVYCTKDRESGESLS